MINDIDSAGQSLYPSIGVLGVPKFIIVLCMFDHFVIVLWHSTDHSGICVGDGS